MKKILIALDYDPTAQKIAETGYSFAKSMGAEVILLHVVSDPVYYSTRAFSPIMGFDGYLETGPVDSDSIDGLIKASQHYLDQIRHHLKDDTIQIRVGEGEFADCILKVAREIHADVIVIGSHSQKWLEKIVMGSVTEKVLKHSTIPLFIIPTRKR
jgi:nucleotide-binding universal stress UspA family protein